MRQWVQKHSRWAVALVLLVEWVVLATGYRISGEPLLDAALQAGLWTALSAVGWMFIWRQMCSTANRLEDNGQILSYIRYPDSHADSLGSA